MSTSAWTTSERAALAQLSGRGPRSILVVHEHAPRFDASGSDLRLMQLVRALAAAGHRLTFVGRQPAREERHVAALEELGVEVLGPDPEALFWEDLAAPRLDLARLCAERRFDDALLFHWYWVGASVAESWLPRLRLHSPQTRIVLLSDDVHSLREERRAREGGGHAALERALGLAAKEACALGAADLVLAITAEDAARMRGLVPDLEPRLVGFCQEEIPAEVPGFAERRGLVFLGSGRNDANARAVRWFLAEVWPRLLARRTELELTLLGEPPQDGWAAPEQCRNVRVAGRVDELEPWLDRARVFVSPIPYGTGLKTKNVAALGRGLPLVLSTISAEGMGLGSSSGGVVRDEPEAFAEAVLHLEGERAAWERASRAALLHARERFSRERLIRDLARALEPSAPWRSSAAEAGLRALAPCTPERTPGGPRSALARLYAERLARAEAARAAGEPAQAALELRLALCELCCLPPEHPTFAQLFARLAKLELAAGDPRAVASTREALTRAPRVLGSGAPKRGRVALAPPLENAC